MVFPLNLISRMEKVWAQSAPHNIESTLTPSSMVKQKPNHMTFWIWLMLAARQTFYPTMASTLGKISSEEFSTHLNFHLKATDTLAHRNFVAAYNLGDGATFWKLFLALIGDNICSFYNYQ